jgi:hypothetical protein
LCLPEWITDYLRFLPKWDAPEAIAPILESELGLQYLVPNNFNTDTFGTFTRDIPRPADQIATARLKAKKALEITGGTIAIASEGSFAPHPDLPFIASNRETVVLIDTLLNRSIQMKFLKE